MEKNKQVKQTGEATEAAKKKHTRSPTTQRLVRCPAEKIATGAEPSLPISWKRAPGWSCGSKWDLVRHEEGGSAVMNEWTNRVQSTLFK
mmetsp:Transcript_27050/g.43731  ORF Transcript_27050/g.43731 Transcript_27050/m.43731 type:complete len:89 (+) Transcript_27050:221-487(+)